jgi:hypothetical protein
MNVKRYAIAGGLVVLAGALIFFYALFHRPERAGQAPGEAATPVYPVSETARLRRVHLYFSGPDHTFLVAETRELPDSSDPSELGKHIVQALVDGPRSQGVRTLPASTVVRNVFITDDGTAYVDFSEEVTKGHPGGVQTELVSIYSVVNSLVLNLEGILAVKLLIGGQEADTLAGHMDLRFPFKANILLVK